MSKEIISTKQVPQAIGTYSQGVVVQGGKTFYISGQIPLDAATMKVVSDDIEVQIKQVFHNLAMICDGAGCQLSDIVKINIYLTDLAYFAKVNEIMASFFDKPYPARAAVGVRQLPKDVKVEMDAIANIN